MFTCEFCENSDKTFLKNPLDGYFCIKTFRLFKKDEIHIFRLRIFSASSEDWEQEWAHYFDPLARGLFSTQSNICDVAFLQN